MIYIKAYLVLNLGDDLFLQLLAQRYKNTQFLAICPKTYPKQLNKNVNCINENSKITKIINKFIQMISLKKSSLKSYLLQKSDAIIEIGGSMFMENRWTREQEYPDKAYYILGSNFGPYETEAFYQKYNTIFSKAKDVCFREEHSYQLFKNLPNVRWASDIVFSLDTSSITITNAKKVVMSIVDCSRKAKPEYKKEYENKIIDMIHFFDKKGYEVVLMSYCKEEGDEEAIHSILNQITEETLRAKIKTYFYNGNIQEALNIMGDCQIVVGTRFHANILGLVLNKTILPIAYSDKTLNVLKDMNFKGKVFDIRDLNSFDVQSLTQEDLNYQLDVSFQTKDAFQHFEKLDQLLGEKRNGET